MTQPAGGQEFAAAGGRYVVGYRSNMTMMDRLEYDTQAWAPPKAGPDGEPVRDANPAALARWLIGRFCTVVTMKGAGPVPFTLDLLDQLPDDGEPGDGFAVRLAAHLHREVVVKNIRAVEAEKKS